MMQGHAGPGVALNRPVDKPPFDKPMEPPTLGDMVSRPPKGGGASVCAADDGGVGKR